MTWLCDENIISNKVVSIGDALEGIDYRDLDIYFSKKTKFTYQGQSSNYKEASNILKNVLDKHDLHFGTHAFYATSIITNDSMAKCKVISWILNKNNVSTEMDIEITLKRTLLLKWDIVEVTSKDSIFGYLFVDNSINPNMNK